MSGLTALLQASQQPPQIPPGDGSNSSLAPAAPPPPPAGDGSILSQLKSNPLFTAGFGIVGITAGLAVLRKGFVSSTSLLRRQLLVDLEIPSKDKSYDWFLHWMSAHQRGQLPHQQLQSSLPPKKTSLLSRFVPRAHHLAVETTYTQHPNGALSTTFSLIPGPGKHLLNYKDTIISVSRMRDPKHMDLRTGSPFETITLTTLYRDRHTFSQLLSEAQLLAQNLTQGKTVIYTSWGTEWKPFGPPRRKRPLDSVILDTGVKEDIVTDIKDFMASSKWYYDRGIPYRRGYLLHGPPGSGKSSFINALAGELDYNICLINLSERGLTDDRLNHLLTNLPERSIALLEDVDAAFGRREVVGEDGYRGANVTFSGLLNALDGVASGEERVVMLTTNYRNRLDEALVRPGRVDREIYVGWASVAQVGEMWERFYGPEYPVQKEQFLQVLKDSGAFKLQGLFVYNKGDPEGAVRMVGEMVRGGKVFDFVCIAPLLAILL
ncbi:BCS1 N terminal-domain-containing protein [Peziza echinospora]|nr:BCS1 N terminal-domain-containing protein [Peziza echinospora]